MEEQPLNQELCYDNDSDDDDTVSAKHFRLTPTHKDALQWISQFIKHCLALQPKLTIFCTCTIILKHSGLQLRW
jgi:hypothetical protein